MLALCDKIMVMCHGQLMGVVPADKVTKEQIGLMMTGSLNTVNAKEGKVAGIARDSVLTEEEWEEGLEYSALMALASESEETEDDDASSDKEEGS